MLQGILVSGVLHGVSLAWLSVLIVTEVGHVALAQGWDSAVGLPILVSCGVSSPEIHRLAASGETDAFSHACLLLLISCPACLLCLHACASLQAR